jgi:hypothetical protein
MVFKVTRLDSLGTGDILLYSGSHPLHQYQREKTGCPWGQIGIILDLPGGYCVFESTKIATCKDIKFDSVVCGVQIVPLVDRLSSFSGLVASRRLEPALPEELIARLLAFAEEVHGEPFNDNKWIAFRAIRRRNKPRAYRGYFCSELVAEAYQRIGLIAVPPGGRSSNNYVPTDFSKMYSDRMLSLQMGFRLGDELLLKETV